MSYVYQHRPDAITKARMPWWGRTTPPVSDEVRTCNHDSCGTVLSRYNPDPFCFIHDPDREPE